MSLGTGYVEGRRLAFDKRGRDGSGKCDAELTGNHIDRVYGVLFAIRPDEKAALDKVEGLGDGYEELTVDVVTERGSVRAVTYIASRKQPALRPYHWYKAMTIAGAVEQGLPHDYVAQMTTFESVEDPNGRRRREIEALLRTVELPD